MITHELYAELVKRIEKNEEVILKLQDKSGDLAIQQATANTKLDHITKIVERLETTVTELAKQPAKRWDKVINALITASTSAIVAGIVTFAASKH